jgi:Dolichyl-phosphate-mannose-protein mannosyltransferase
MDPIALLTNAVVATIVSVLLFVLPGAALGWLVLPGTTTPAGRVGRAAGVSLLATLLTCTILARIGALTVGSVLVTLIGLTAVGVLLRRPRLAVPWRRRRARRWWAGALAGAAFALVIVVVPSHLRLRPDLLPDSSTTWYYLHLAQATADLGAFPAQLAEWGAMRPFPTDYLPVTAHTAAALLLLPGDVLVRLELYRVIILALGLLFAALLFRRWVSGWVALLGAILLLGTVRLEGKFDGYRPETVALVVALFALWVADRAFAERSPRIFAVAMVATALVFLSHAEVFLVLAPALVGIGVARALVAPGRSGGRVGLRWPTRRAWTAPALAVALVVGGIALGVAAGWALTGQARVLGYVLDPGTAAPDADASRGRPGEIPAGWTFTDDPTWDFYTASVAPALDGRQPPDAFTDSLLLPRSILVVWPGLDGRSRSGLVVLAALLFAPLLAWPFLDGRRRRWLLTWAIFAAALVAGSLLLFALSDTYVPQRTAGRRLMPYLLFVPVVATTLLLWIGGRLAAPYWRSLLPGRGRAIAAGLALAVLTAGAVSAAPTADPVTDDRDAALSPTGYDAYRWMADNLPADARILANAYTDGSIAAVTGRVGIVDGRAVYLEDPEFLAESTALSLGARVVFGTPASPGAASYLARERVTHLLVATAGPLGRDLGGYLLFDTDVDALRSDPRFRLVRSFGDDRLLLFEVVGAEPAAAATAAR